MDFPAPDAFSAPDAFFWAGADCTQRVDLPDGTALVPVYAMPREAVGSNFWRSCFFATVVRAAFDDALFLAYTRRGAAPPRRAAVGGATLPSAWRAW